MKPLPNINNMIDLSYRQNKNHMAYDFDCFALTPDVAIHMHIFWDIALNAGSSQPIAIAVFHGQF